LRQSTSGALVAPPILIATSQRKSLYDSAQPLVLFVRLAVSAEAAGVVARGLLVAVAVLPFLVDVVSVDQQSHSFLVDVVSVGQQPYSFCAIGVLSFLFSTSLQRKHHIPCAETGKAFNNLHVLYKGFVTVLISSLT
jgi:hypothetical protein